MYVQSIVFKSHLKQLFSFYDYVTNLIYNCFFIFHFSVLEYLFFDANLGFWWIKTHAQFK